MPSKSFLNSTYFLRTEDQKVPAGTIRLLIAFLGNGSQKSLPRKAFLGKPRPAGRLLAKKTKRCEVIFGRKSGAKIETISFTPPPKVVES